MLPNQASFFGSSKSCLKYAALAIFFTFYQFTNAQLNRLDSLKHSLTIFENAKDFNKNDTKYIDLLNDIAFEYQYKNIDSLKYFSEKAYSLSDNSHYSNGKGKALNNLSQYKFYVGENLKGFDYLNGALAIAKNDKNIDLQIGVLKTLGNQWMDFGHHAEALKAYLNAIDLATISNDIINISITKENVGNLYFAQRDYEQSLLLYKEVELLNEELKDEERIAQTQSNIAAAYIKLNDLKNAARYIDQSIEFFKKAKIFEWLAYCYNVKGDIYLKQNNPNLALYWYDKAMLLHENLSDDRYKVPLINSIAEAYYSLNNYTEAEKYTHQAIEIATKLSLIEDPINSYELLYKINSAKKNYSNALKYHELFKRLSDSISRKENLNSLGSLKTKLEFEKQTKDAALEVALENEKVKAKQNIYLYISLVILAILGLIIYLLRKQSKTRKIFNNELQLKTNSLKIREEELSTINATKDRLFSIIGHDLKGPINALGSILYMLKEKEISTEEFDNFIPKFKNDVDAISFTLNNLLSWGRTQMTGSSIEAIKFDIYNLTDENIKLLNEIADNKSITIKNNIHADTTVWADKNQIDVIIRNLLSNALKFTFIKGSIEINAVKKADFVEVSIKDNGVGMEPEIKNKLFKDENALMSTYGTANEKGTGLGLSLCKEMVENNGGKIWVDSVFGKGSTFYFTIPVESSQT